MADLQVADAGGVVDLHVAGVGVGQLDSVPEPEHLGRRMGLHFAADVRRVPFPRVDRHLAQDLWSVWTNREECQRLGRN